MAGRKLRDAVRSVVLVIAGLTNTYSQYVTTFEEYQIQRYEGASTLFGTHTHSAYIQEFQKLTSALVNGQTVESGPQPPDLLDKQISLLTPVVMDATPHGVKFGDVKSDMQKNSSFKRGDNVTVVFWSALLNKGLRSQENSFESPRILLTNLVFLLFRVNILNVKHLADLIRFHPFHHINHIHAQQIKQPFDIHVARCKYQVEQRVMIDIHKLFVESLHVLLRDDIVLMGGCHVSLAVLDNLREDNPHDVLNKIGGRRPSSIMFFMITDCMAIFSSNVSLSELFSSIFFCSALHGDIVVSAVEQRG